MHIKQQINEILIEIMDIDPKQLTPESYLIRDLGAESIDLLELAVTLNHCFQIEVDEDAVFLRTLRSFLQEAQAKEIDAFSGLQQQYPFLAPTRISEILSTLDQGPVLKVKDLIHYIEWHTEDEHRIAS